MQACCLIANECVCCMCQPVTPRGAPLQVHIGVQRVKWRQAVQHSGRQLLLTDSKLCCVGGCLLCHSLYGSAMQLSRARMHARAPTSLCAATEHRKGFRAGQKR